MVGINESDKMKFMRFIYRKMYACTAQAILRVMTPARKQASEFDEMALLPQVEIEMFDDVLRGKKRTALPNTFDGVPNSIE